MAVVPKTADALDLIESIPTAEVSTVVAGQDAEINSVGSTTVDPRGVPPTVLSQSTGVEIKIGGQLLLGGARQRSAGAQGADGAGAEFNGSALDTLEMRARKLSHEPR